MRKRLFYDIETSKTVFSGWRTGKQFVGAHQIMEHTKIICISWKWESEDKVHNLNWGLKQQCDKKLLEKFIPILESADQSVGHNSDGFDLKWIRSRAMFHDIPMSPYFNTIDTYKIVKSICKLPSYSLANCCNYFSLEAKRDSGGDATWNGVQFEKSQEALDTMLYYCDGDILSLQALYEKIRPYSKAKMHYAALGMDEKFFCPECTQLPKWNKTYTTASGTIQHYMKCRGNKCGTAFKINNKTYQDYLQYKMVNGIK